MRPLSDFPEDRAAGLRGLLFDVDDTLTSGGRLTAEAYAALERLHHAGLLVMAITGRPAGWCDLIARFWPVDGVVGENGAFYFRYCRDRRSMIRRFAQDDAERADNRRRLDSLAQVVLAQVPGAALAADQPYRVCDLAIDTSEDVAALASDQIARIVELCRRAGANAKVSSIHVNAWFGDHDKLTMTRRLLDEAFGVGSEAAAGEFVFVGDSPNDAPMFEAFPYAVGVANVLAFTRSAVMPSGLRDDPAGRSGIRRVGGICSGCAIELEGEQSMLNPDGRVIMVSGANRGIGLAVARALHDRGYNLSLGARDLDGLQSANGQVR